MSFVLPKTVNAFVWHYLRAEKKYLVGFFCVSLIWSAEMSLSPYLLKIIIDTVVAESADISNLFHVIFIPIVLYASMSLILNLNFRLYNYINLRLNPKLKSRVHHDVFTYVLAHSYTFFQNHLVGSLTRKISDLVISIESLIAIPNEWFIPRSLAALVASATLFYVVHPVFGLILLGWGLLFVIFSYICSKHSGRLSSVTSEAASEMDGASTDALANAVSIKLFDTATYQLAWVAKTVAKLVKNDRAFQWYNLKVYLVQGLGVTFLMVSMLFALLNGLKVGYVTAGDFALVLMLSSAFMGAVYDLGSQMQLFSKIKGTCRQALTVLTIPHGVIDAPQAQPLKITHGAIQFKNVQFAYLGQSPLFDALTLDIKPGEKVGLVGHSGAGKSTFVHLILRLFDIQRGEIKIDGQSIRHITQSSLRRQIGVIPQVPELFHQSIFKNIQFARPDASYDEVIDAAKKARCHDFIMTLPNQYDALVGERGVKLSGGQKQRIAIARAFLKNAPILLLDEATSALDSLTERDIHAALHEIMKHKTTLVIAHRLATLKDMDRILVFSDGKIVEDGTLQALLKNKKSIFYSLWQMQSDGFIT